MENKINVAKILKDCPEGMELDCTMYNNVTFIAVENTGSYPIKLLAGSMELNLTKSGCYSNSDDAKCVIFPKGKTTWEGFCIPFKNGDIVYFVTEHGNEYITIYKNDSNVYLETYIDLAVITSRCSLDSSFYIDNIKKQRLASEEEKQKLFDAIKANGYRWDEETKTLEKLPMFKDGDVIVTSYAIAIFKQVHSLYEEPQIDFYCGVTSKHRSFILKTGEAQHCGKISSARLATEEEKAELFKAIKNNGYHWNPETKTLEKLVEPKFKVGDVIEKCGHTFTIADVKDECYLTKCGNKLPIGNQDDFNLISNKFDITSFKPFDKVLVRDHEGCIWRPDFYSHYEQNQQYWFVCVGDAYKQCIPYNEETANLLSTGHDCPDKYKIWKR